MEIISVIKRIYKYINSVAISVSKVEFNSLDNEERRNGTVMFRFVVSTLFLSAKNRSKNISIDH